MMVPRKNVNKTVLCSHPKQIPTLLETNFDQLYFEIVHNDLRWRNIFFVTN